MSSQHSRRTLRPAVAAFRERRAATAAHKALLRDVNEYSSQADLADLAATLRRHDDRDSAPVRNAVDWTRAA